MKKICVILLLLLSCRLFADEVLPPKPADYFNDYAHVVSAATAQQLNHTLADFERESSDQIVVAVFPHMQSDSSIDDYTVRVARSWQVGQKNKNNGVVLFVYIQDHRMFIQVGYGLEGVLPDALCKRIIDEQIAPAFKAGNFDNGLTAGVHAILSAIKGEYKGNGQTVAQSQSATIYHSNPFNGNLLDGLAPFLILMVFIFLAVSSAFARRSDVYGSSGRRRTSSGWGGWLIDNNNWGGGSSSGGDFSGGGGSNDSFSSGGGSFGGGGAGGSW